MADWRQIQARIRKARVGADAIAKMTELYEQSRDGMVAFELAKLHEQAGTRAMRLNGTRWRGNASGAIRGA